MAMDMGLDLVEMNSNGQTVIAKIMDYGKFKYEQKKRASDAKKKQKSVEVKEVWVKPFIEENDLKIKMKKLFEFLADGNKVKVAVMTKGSKKFWHAVKMLFQNCSHVYWKLLVTKGSWNLNQNQMNAQNQLLLRLPRSQNR